ncbi:hypothetical protein DXT63_09760 [Thermoanaerobacteraceae bacterium SP2]|nr:hypothetical protein DXT63_09760 [Thermoanaerobacteraceae bacterium SP2]
MSIRKKINVILLMLLLFMIWTCSSALALDEYATKFVQHRAISADWGALSFNFYVDYGANTTVGSQYKWIDYNLVSAYKTEDCVIYPDEIGNGDAYFVEVYETVDGDEIDSLGPSAFDTADGIWDPDTIVYYNYESNDTMASINSGTSAQATHACYFFLDDTWVPGNKSVYVSFSF